tara:strand:- start:4753 stop:4953 length:201 start_codon:yes stop_codon:yes gene_type:complete
MRHKVEITLPTIPWETNTRDLLSYLQVVIAELTGDNPIIRVNDIDFTDKVDVFKKIRQKSFPNRGF